MKGTSQMKRTAALFLLCLLFLSGCAATMPEPSAQSATDPVTGTVFAMDTVMDLTIYGTEDDLSEAEALIGDLEVKLSVTDEDSEIYAANRDRRGTLSEDAADLLAKAMALCADTDGALDLSIYPVVRAWGFTTGNYAVPDQETLDELLTHVVYTKIQLDSNTVTLAPEMEIDLGSVAKGYTGDRVLDLLRENGVTSALLNLGGNVQALGAKPDGSPWRVAVQNPTGNDYLGVLEVTDQSVITSGGYERYFEQDGVTYWHIIDPSTGAPARSGLISVTIVGDSGLVCDGLSTALFVMGLEDATDFWRSRADFEAVLVTEDGQVYVTQGLADTFALLDDSRGEVEVIQR
jgi:thiamine biosynthesis lipoprotein